MIDEIFITLMGKRLCISKNDLITIYYLIIPKYIFLKGIIKDNARHAAAITYHGNSNNIISYGINKYNYTFSIHAEYDAIKNLPTVQIKKKKISIDLYVGKFSINGNYLMSKPCDRCINNMINILPDRGYKIINIFYTNIDGTIIKTNLTDLNLEPHYYTKANRRFKKS